MTDAKTIRCTDCAATFTDAEIENATGCPSCGTTSSSQLIADDVTIRVNWHDLRILGIWASWWAEAQFPGEPSERALKSILARIEAQHPERTKLTFAGELRQAANATGLKIEHHVRGKVETFDPEKPS